MLVNILIIIVIYFLSRRLQRAIKSRWLRWLVTVPVFTATTFVLMYFSTVNQQNAVTTQDQIVDNIVDVTEARLDDLTVTISATGILAPQRQVPLTFQGVAPISNIFYDVGDTVPEGEVIAELDSTDSGFALNDARIALELQKTAFEALTGDPRDVDIAAAEAALEAAQAQFNAATQTGSTALDEELANLQVELAQNRRWQTQLQGNSNIGFDTSLPSFNLEIPSVPSSVDVDVPDALVTAIDTATGVTIDDPLVLDTSDISNQLDSIASAVDVANQQSAAAAALQSQLSDNQQQLALDQAEYSVQIANANLQSTLSRGPDVGSLSAANSSRIRAQITLDNLLNGPDELQVQLANIDLQLSELALEQAEWNEDLNQLKAPFTGIISQSNMVEAQLPPQNFAVLLMDTSAFYVDLPVDEIDITKVRMGQRVEFSIDALPDENITGEVVRIAFTPTRLGQLITYNVRVRLDETEANVRVGMSVTGRIVLSDRTNVLLVPNRFIRFDRLTQQAFVAIRQDDGTVQEINVLLGEQNELDSEILSGLSIGQEIVLLPRDLQGLLTEPD